MSYQFRCTNRGYLRGKKLIRCFTTSSIFQCPSPVKIDSISHSGVLSIAQTKQKYRKVNNKKKINNYVHISYSMYLKIHGYVEITDYRQQFE